MPREQRRGLALQPRDFFWALVGLSLTVGFTHMHGAIYLPYWQNGFLLQLRPINASLQVAGVLLTTYLGGSTSAALAQVLYLLFGMLGWGELQVFGEGGGLNYWQKPTFGYLLGFAPGALLGGYLAFSSPRDLTNFVWSGILCLTVIHLIGIGYIGIQFFHNPRVMLSYWQMYSFNILPAHFTIICGSSLIAYLVRLALLY